MRLTIDPSLHTEIRSYIITACLVRDLRQGEGGSEVKELGRRGWSSFDTVSDHSVSGIGEKDTDKWG